jgi:acyl-CoA thioesterase FadM
LTAGKPPRGGGQPRHRFSRCVSVGDTETNGRHLTFDKILGLFRDCWCSFFLAVGAGLHPSWMLLRHLQADFAGEVTAGEISLSVRVRATGRTSVRLELTACQAERQVSRLEAVFVRCDPVTGKPSRLAEPELSALSRYR